MSRYVQADVCVHVGVCATRPHKDKVIDAVFFSVTLTLRPLLDHVSGYLPHFHTECETVGSKSR